MAKKKKQKNSRTLRQWFWRCLFYVLGMMILAEGICMNAMTGLGVSPIITIPYNISVIWNLKLADTTLIIYIVFVIAQFVLKGERRTVFDLFQIVLSLFFTRFMNIINTYQWIECHNKIQQFALLFAAICCTGTGVAMSTSMRLIPNPGDGIVQAISDRIGKSMGFSKNLFDCTCMVISVIMGLVFTRSIIGIGLGTVFTMVGTGRAVAVFQYFFHKKILRAAGFPAE